MHGRHAEEVWDVSKRSVPQLAPTSTAQHPTLSHSTSCPAIIDVLPAKTVIDRRLSTAAAIALGA